MKTLFNDAMFLLLKNKISLWQKEILNCNFFMSLTTCNPFCHGMWFSKLLRRLTFKDTEYKVLQEDQYRQESNTI